MQPAPQPFVRAQQPLAASWRAFYEAPQLRLGRWLTTEADRPLLHDYLLGLSAGPRGPLRRLSAGSSWAAGGAGGSAAVVWLEQPGPETEKQLRAHLAGPHAPRLLVLEDAAAQPWQRLARWFPAAVYTCTPTASMRQLLADLRHTAPANEPAGCFQRHFHALTEAIGRLDSPGVAAQLTACLAAAAALPGPGAAVTAWLAAGQHFLASKQAKEAQRYFAGALASAEATFSADGDATAGLLAVQAWLGEAAAWQQLRCRPAALASLRQASDRAAQLAPSLLGVEAARQLGHALTQDGQPRPALASYERGLRLAEQLPAGQQAAATIQALGAAYLQGLRSAPDQQALRARLACLATSSPT